MTRPNIITREAMERMARDGTTAAEAARLYGVAQETIRRLEAQFGITLKRGAKGGSKPGWKKNPELTDHPDDTRVKAWSASKEAVARALRKATK